MALVPPSHDSHDSSWSFCIPYQDEVICFACALDILQEETMLLVRKRRALTELSSLLQLPHLIQKLASNGHITSHVLLVLLELMKNKDKEFSSSVIEVFMKMMLKMDSEDLVMFILNVINEECKSEREDHQRLLYLYVVLGRLAQSSTLLVRHLQQDFEPLLRLICSDIYCVDEEVQSSIAFIMVYVLIGPWETTLSPVLLQKLGRDLISVLNSAKSQGLILNALAVLKKLVESDDMVHYLIKMDIGKDSVMSVLKKLLVSKTEEFQVASVTILSSIANKREGEYCMILLQSDLLEFLFEAIQCRNVQMLQSVFRCLKPLCQREEFYTQCHSVYGIESVLRCFNILADMKNFDLMTDTFIILSTILKNQPDSSHLFINTGSVRNCLDVIGSGLKENNQGVFCSAITAFQYVLKKEHLLCPIPFEILQGHLVTVSTKIWQQVFVNSMRSFTSKSRRTSTPEFDPVGSLLSVCLASIRLLEQCDGDPTACQSNYDSPSKGSNQYNSQCQFQENLLNVCSECAIPVALDCLEKKMTDDVLLILLRLIYNIKKRCDTLGSDVIYKLISAGFLTKTLETKSTTGQPESEVEFEVNRFLQSVIEVLYKSEERPNNSSETMCQDLVGAIPKVKYSFSVLSQALGTLQLDTDVLYTYLFLLSHLCQLVDECPISLDQLFQVVKLAGKGLKDMKVSDIPDVIKRCFIFLWGYIASLENLNVDKNGGAFGLLVDIVSHDPPEKWYTHHPALVYWMYRDPYVCSIAGNKIITEWLEHLCEVLAKTDHSEWLETTDGQLMLEMFSEEKFSKIYLKVFAQVSPNVVETAFFVFEAFMETLADSDDRRVSSFMSMMREEIRENLNETFLHSKDKEANIEYQLLLLMKVYNHCQFTLDGMDIKIFYHVTKWVTKNRDFHGSLLESCLKMLILFCRYTEVVPLLLQNSDIILTLDHLLNQGSVRSRSRTGDVVTQLILYCKEHKAVKVSSSIRLDIQPVAQHLHSSSVWESHTYLHILNALLMCKFVSPVVTLKQCGRFPDDDACPLISMDFRVLFVHLQQNVTQDTSLLKEISFECMLSLLDYADERCPKLAGDLIDHPWNSLLLEVLCQTTDTCDSTAVLLAKFIDKVKASQNGHELLQESEALMSVINKFVESLSSATRKEEEVNS